MGIVKQERHFKFNGVGGCIFQKTNDQGTYTVSAHFIPSDTKHPSSKATELAELSNLIHSNEFPVQAPFDSFMQSYSTLSLSKEVNKDTFGKIYQFLLAHYPSVALTKDILTDDRGNQLTLETTNNSIEIKLLHSLTHQPELDSFISNLENQYNVKLSDAKKGNLGTIQKGKLALDGRVAEQIITEIADLFKGNEKNQTLPKTPFLEPHDNTLYKLATQELDIEIYPTAEYPSELIVSLSHKNKLLTEEWPSKEDAIAEALINKIQEGELSHLFKTSSISPGAEEFSHTNFIDAHLKDGFSAKDAADAIKDTLESIVNKHEDFLITQGYRALITDQRLANQFKGDKFRN